MKAWLIAALLAFFGLSVCHAGAKGKQRKSRQKPPPEDAEPAESRSAEDREQNPQEGQYTESAPNREAQPPEFAPAEEPPRPEPPRGPMTLHDARINLPTIVETYISQNSPDGHFTMKDKAGKTWKLDLEAIYDKGVHKVPGRERFAACAMFREWGGLDRHVDVDFTVDFSGARWKVTEVKLHKLVDMPKPKQRRRPPSAPEKDIQKPAVP